MAYGFPNISFIGYPVSIPCAGHAGMGFREARPGDEAAILGHFLRLSPNDRRRRFCATVSDDHLAGHVAGLRQRNSFTVTAHDGPLWDGPFHRAGEVRALAEVVVWNGEAEIGLSVDGTRRRAGVGTYLVQTAARLLAARGIERLVAVTLPHNHAMLGLGRALGAEVETGDGETVLRFAVSNLHGAYLRRRAAQVFQPQPA